VGSRGERFAMPHVPQLGAPTLPLVMRFLSFWAAGQRRTRAQMSRALCRFAYIICLVATVPAWGQSLAAVKPEDVGLSAERLERIQGNRTSPVRIAPTACGGSFHPTQPA
jgi:hypothetical protein